MELVPLHAIQLISRNMIVAFLCKMGTLERNKCLFIFKFAEFFSIVAALKISHYGVTLSTFVPSPSRIMKSHAKQQNGGINERVDFCICCSTP